MQEDQSLEKIAQELEELVDAEEPHQELGTPRWDFKPRQNPKWGTVTKEGLVIGRGTNKKVVNPDEVYAMASYGCTIEEMADFFGVSRDTLKYNFHDYIRRGYSETRQRLRQAQLKTALSGNPALLIWLGKNMLGQSESPAESQANEPLPWTD